MKVNAVFIAALLFVSSFVVSGAEKSVLLQRAHEAYLAAQALEGTLNEKPEADRTCAEYLKVINAYQRTYLITPTTSYADDALTSVARLYEEMKDNADAIKTLQFLIHAYPGTPFKDAAEKDIARLSNITTTQTQTAVQTHKTAPVENIRYFETPHSVHIVINVGNEVRFAQGKAKDPD